MFVKANPINLFKMLYTNQDSPFSEEQLYWRIQLSENKPQLWGTLSIGDHNTGVETLNICFKLLIKTFNAISHEFVRRNRKFFVRAIFSNQLHFHFYLWFPKNPSCNFRHSRRSHLKAVKKKEFAEPYFSSHRFFDPIKKEFPFPEADLDVKFYDEEKGHAELYGTGSQNHNPDKLNRYDSSNFFGTNEFLYQQNFNFKPELRLKEVPLID